MSSVLPGASSADTAQPGSVVFLLDPTPYRVLRCNARSESLLVYPAFGKKKSSFFAPKSTIWSPPKPSATLAINTDPMEIDVPMSPSPVPPPIFPDIADNYTLTSPVPTQSVACFTDSAADMEFAALLKDVDELEALRVAYGAEKERLIRLEIQFQKHREILAQTQQQLEAKTQESKILDRNVKDLKNTAEDLRNDVDTLKADRGAIPMLHDLMYHFCTPNHEYMTRVYSTTLFYKILGCCSSSPLADIKKNYHRLMRLCHPDKHPHISTHISQRLNEIYDILSDQRSRQIYDCCGASAVLRRDSSHFCRMCNPRPFYESCDDLWT